MITQDINDLVRKGELTKIENYDRAIADETQTWICHHRLGLTMNGEFAHSAKDLQRLGMYYHRPYFELIFLTRNEHNRIHGKAKSFSDETRKKISKAKKGKPGIHPSEETRKKLSDAHKGKPKSADAKRKLSEALKGRSSPNKGKSCSVFGKKFVEHFGICRCDNINLYNREYNLFVKHGKCSWE